MKKNPQVLIQHILDSIEWVEKDTKGMSKEDFYKNVPVQDAVMRRLEIIGEAVRNLPDDYKNSHPETPWQDIADMRNKLIHEYFEVDLELVWEVVLKDIPQLKNHLKG